MNIWQQFNNQLTSEMRDDLLFFTQIANEEKINIYLVGGAVRDIIIGRNITDADIMVEGDATDFANIVKKHTGGKLLIHDAFFTAVLFLTSGRKYDFTSCRKEYYPYPGSLPITSPGSIRDDLFRRDFTINAMAMQLNGDSHGEVIDIFNGIDDISNKTIKVLHENSFISDPTRIFRAVRFETKLGFTINAHTELLANEAISNRIIDRVSGERIYNEIKQICNNELTQRIIGRFHSINLLSSISINWNMPDMADFEQLELMIKKNKVSCPTLFRIAWLISFAETKDDIKLISQRLKMSNFEKKHLISSADIMNCLSKIAMDLSLGGIDVAVKSMPRDTVVLISFSADVKTMKLIDQYLSMASVFKPLINGEDLIKEGIHPGREMHRLMNAVRYAQFNGSITDRNQAIELIKQLTN